MKKIISKFLEFNWLLNLVLLTKIRLFNKNKYFINIPKEWVNSSLKRKDDIIKSTHYLRHIGLPLVEDRAKNWDSLIFFDFIIRNSDNNVKILDAGAEIYSRLLPWLQLYGYNNLTGINIVFKKRKKIGNIEYLPGDITKTSFEKETFDFIICQSVIEHGVDITNFLLEMNRVLKTNGYLLLSTDYFDEKINTDNLTAYGVPIKIFSKNEIDDLLSKSKNTNLRLISELDDSCIERPVIWSRYNLKYTFINLIFKKNET